MRSSRIGKDRSGKEAFAYLSIIIVVISSGYISYLIWLQKQGEEEIEDAEDLHRIMGELTSVVSDIELTIHDLHDDIFLEMVSNTSSWNSTRMDSELEGRLIKRLGSIVQGLLHDRNGSGYGCRFDMDDISISVTPLRISQMMPTSGISGSKPNGTGPWTYGWRPGSMGTNSTISMNIKANTEDSSLSTSRAIELKIERTSVTDILVNRLVRLEMAMTGTELSELFQHIVSSLVRTKAFLGSGRSVLPGHEETIPELLTHDEIQGCLDLSVHLLSKAYLGSFDLEGLMNVESSLRSVRGSYGCSPTIVEMLEDNDGPVDPAMLVLISEGLFSEEYPPSVDDLLRPFLLSILERMVLDLVNYFGIDSGMLKVFGGSFNMFVKATESFDDLSETIFGRRMIDNRDDAVRNMIRSFYRLEPALKGNDGKLFLQTIPGEVWDGKEVEGYPKVDLGRMERNFSLMVPDGNSGHEWQEYSIYNVTAIFDPEPVEPDFHNVDLLDNGSVIDGISSVLGVDEGYIATEIQLREHMESALRNAIEDLMDGLSVEGTDSWDRIWKGWGHASYPSLDDRMEPTSFLIGLSLGSVPDIVSELGPCVINSIELAGLSDIVQTTIGAMGGSMVGFFADKYNNVTHREEQLDHAEYEMVREIPEKVDIEVLSCSFSGSVVIESGDEPNGIPVPDDVDEALSDPSLLFKIAFTLLEKDDPDQIIHTMIRTDLESSFDEVKEREVGTGYGVHDIGIIRRTFQLTPTRGDVNLPFPLPWEWNNSSISDRLQEILYGVIMGIMNDATGSESFSRSRHFLPDLGGNRGANVRLDYLGSAQIMDLDTIVNVDPGYDLHYELMNAGGAHDTDPATDGSPYTSYFELHVLRSYEFDHSTQGGSNATREVAVDLMVQLTTYTSWPMEGSEYTLEETLMDIAMDKAKEAVVEFTNRLLNASEPIISNSLSSLQEIPPIVMDLMENSDLDLAEISRVATNVTMDLSSTLREGIKDLIKELIEMGLSEILSTLCELIGIDRFEVGLSFGPLDMVLSSEKEALNGNEGALLEMVVDMAPIGLHGYFGIRRVENGTMRFNGTITIEKGPLYLRIELDPFMEDHPHLFSLEGVFGEEGSSKTRISFYAPGLVEYRVSEVSISSSLGVEPVVPIPPLGIQAVFDAGFRLRYRMPDELPPTLNELGFIEGNLSWIEVFDPRSHPFSGSTIEVCDENDEFICSWILRHPPDPYTLIELGEEEIWRWNSTPDLEDRFHIILRSPSGVVLDDVWIDGVQGDSIGRDNDGFGIWKWGDPTPGSSNGGSQGISIKGMILSIAFSSIKEAWEEAYHLYGLSFETVVHFIQRSVELFLERFIAMISELIVDIRVFLTMEVEDASGSAGGGVELSLRADGEAVALFLEWIYENILILIENIKDPDSSGNLITFPYEILEMCYISILFFTEVETPISVSDMAPEGVQIPDSLTLGFNAEVNLALPMELIGKDIGSWHVSFGILVMEAPSAIVSIFYDVTSFSSTTDLWLIKGEIWEG